MVDWKEFNVNVDTTYDDTVILKFETNNEDNRIQEYSLSLNNVKSLRKMLKAALKFQKES